MRDVTSPLQYFGNRGPIMKPGFHSQQSDDLFTLFTHLKLIHGKRGCCYDLFSGAGSLGILAMIADVAERYIINDAFFGFQWFWQVVQSSPAELIEQYEKQLSALQEHGDKNAYFLMQQNKMNCLLQSQVAEKDKVAFAALLAFIINHAENGMLQFSASLGSIQLNNPYQTDKVDNPITFKENVQGLHQLFQQRNVTFHAKPAQHFRDQIQSQDLALLDPPYPSLPDASEAPAQHLYFRTEKKDILAGDLNTLLADFKEKGVAYFMFYGLCGKEGSPLQPPLASEHVYLHLAGGPHNPYQAYTEYVYVSNHFVPLVKSVPQQRFEQWNNMDPSLVQHPYQEAAAALQCRLAANANLFKEQRALLLHQIFIVVSAIATQALPMLSPALWTHIFSYLHQDDLGKSTTEVKELSSCFFKNATQIREQIREGKAIRLSETIDPDEGFIFKLMK